MHHVAFTIESTRLADLIEVVAPLMPDIKSLQIEHVPPIGAEPQQPRRFDLSRSRTAQAVLMIMHGQPTSTWGIDEISLGMSSHNLASTSAAPATSLLRANGYLTREGDLYRLTEKGLAAPV